MNTVPKTDEGLAALAAHLAARREAILQAWRRAVQADPELTTASSLSRIQFNDHIPDVLDDFEARLRARPGAERAAVAEETKEDAAVHGTHRWQQGYNLRELTREWGHLHLCLVDELEGYAAAHPSLESSVMPSARRALAQLCSEGVSESTAQYFRLRQAEATGHVRDLEQALEELKELERRRAEVWREAAHDLRGNLGVVKNVTSVLTQEGVPEPERVQFFTMLQKGVGALHALLEDVTSLARLQAGHERRDAGPFDAAVLLGELCANVQPLAQERGLFLKANGPRALPVEGDPVKVRRIAQNLLLNALKYTDRGGVTVSWGDSRKNDPDRWMLCVQDTGPGFHAGPGAPLAGALKEATKEAQEVEQKAGKEGEPCGPALSASASASRPDSRPVHQQPGEGIGLSIVKRLCELLDASLELQSVPGEGTTFRVILPRQYG